VSGSLLLVTALVLVLVSIWIWMNVLLVRKRASSKQSSPAPDARQATSTTASESPAPSTFPAIAAASASNQTPPADVGTQQSPALEPTARDSSASHASIEIVGDERPSGSTPFSRPMYPFRLNETSVPAFAEEMWRHCFHRLTEESHVLGWIAFQGEVVGASDRAYESTFLEVLRNYRRTVEKLRKEMGLSHVHETSIVGDEGKVWFLAAVDDAWLALFVDRDVDIQELSDRLLSPIREIGS